MIIYRYPEHLQTLTSLFRKQINILIVDDYPIMRNVLSELFHLPLFNIFFASSEKEAREVIPATSLWHGWILDIIMEHNDSGLSLLTDNRQFPFAIMLSGMRSMNTAARAMELGAYKVFDKDPLLLPGLHEEVCSMAALAYILKGSTTKYFDLFKLLARERIDTVEAWATRACLTNRQLERICTMQLQLAPRFIIPLYYTIQCLLYADGLPDGKSGIDNDDHEHQDEGMEQHLDFVYRNIDRIAAL